MTIEEDFLHLFAPHSTRSFGEYTPNSSTPAKTIKLRPSITDVAAHLAGTKGLGLVPLDVDQCGWAVIDIDNHEGQDVDHRALALLMSPFPGTVVTRSKSGGAHIYFFFKEVLTGKEARELVHQIAMATDLAGNEIFPKQNKIRPDGWGNWINLPYFGGEKTERYAVNAEGERLSLASFLATPRATQHELLDVVASRAMGAPPCIDHLLRNPPAQGHRNMALFSIAVFFKRSSPQTWTEKVHDYAAHRLDPPLPRSEVNTVIRSVSSKDYTYRCAEAPLIDICNKELCTLARHGLTTEQQNGCGEPVQVKSLIKYLTEPPVWDLNTELGPVRVSTKALLSHSLLREAIAERYLKIIPKLKSEEWHAVLSDLMASCVVIEVPDDSTASGLVWAALMEFAAAAYSDDDENTDSGSEEVRWEAGLPIKKDGNIYFSGGRFISWLRRSKRAEGMSPSGVYMALKEKGVEQGRLRTGKTQKRSWLFPVVMMRKAFPVYTGEKEEF